MDYFDNDAVTNSEQRIIQTGNASYSSLASSVGDVSATDISDTCTTNHNISNEN